MGTIVLGALSIWAGAGFDDALSLSTPPVWVLLTFIALGTGLELARHRLRRGAAFGSISFVIFIAAGLLFGPMWGGLIAGSSVAIAQLLSRKALQKVLFNTAQCAMAISLGAGSYVLLGGSVPASSLWNDLVPYVGFVVVYFLLNSSAVSGAVSLSERRPFVEVWVENTLNLAEYDLVASVLGLGTALLYVEIGILGVLAVVVPILFIRHTYAVNLQLQETNRELLDLMVKQIEARDPYTSGHSQRVAELARTLARGMRLGSKDVERVSTAALLHDVGKVYEEYAPILRKEGKLTPEERAIMQTHPVRSAELVGTITSLHGEVYRSVRHHHENYDGTGYPDGLIADQIPVGARIIMVADTVDAMTTDRPYRRALPFSKVVEELRRFVGKQFDPEVVEAFDKFPEVRALIDRLVPPESVLPIESKELSATFDVKGPAVVV